MPPTNQEKLLEQSKESIESARRVMLDTARIVRESEEIVARSRRLLASTARERKKKSRG